MTSLFSKIADFNSTSGKMGHQHTRMPPTTILERQHKLQKANISPSDPNTIRTWPFAPNFGIAAIVSGHYRDSYGALW